MRWPIRNQILVPFAVALAVAVGLIAITSSWLAARSEERETVDRLRRVVRTLGGSNFPYSTNVLTQMRGLSGAEFVALDANGDVAASTLPDPRPAASAAKSLAASQDVSALDRRQAIDVAGVRHLAMRVRTPGPNSLLVLYPEQRWAAARWEAAWPPLAVGAATAVAMAAVSAWLSRRIGRRVDVVRGLFARIADGAFEQAVAEPPHDELYDLVQSANRLSDRLREMQQTIGQTERVRLLAQLAGGLAHQLRNSVTGARLALQLHQRRCPGATADDLDVALRQLSLTEEQVKGLLALGRRDDGPPLRGELGDLFEEIERLVGPACHHARVRWERRASDDVVRFALADYGRVRAALLNLSLNAIEAAGSGGEVRLTASPDRDGVRIEIADTGPGPPDKIRESLFDPFVTLKPDGIGLGLALVRQAAEELGGAASWERRDGLTVFTFRIPAAGQRLAAPAGTVAR